MPKIIKVGKARTPRVFIASMWKNISKKGLEYFNISFDKGVKVKIQDTRNGQNKSYEFKEDTSIQGFDNPKREGKQDPDSRLSFTEPKQE